MTTNGSTGPPGPRHNRKILVALIAVVAGAGAAVVPMVLTGTAEAAAATIWARGSVHTVLSEPDTDRPCDYRVDDENSIDDGVDIGTDSSDEARICANNVDVRGSVRITADFGLGVCDGVTDDGLEVTVSISASADHLRAPGSDGVKAAAAGPSEKFCVRSGVPYDFSGTAYSGTATAEATLTFGVDGI